MGGDVDSGGGPEDGRRGILSGGGGGGVLRMETNEPNVLYHVRAIVHF